MTMWFSSVVAALYNIFTRKQGTPAHRIEEFAVRFSDEVQGPREQTQSLEAQKNILMMIAKAHAKGAR